MNIFSYLISMAFNRKQAIDFIHNIEPEIIEHLCKIAVINEHRDIYVNDWTWEILTWLRQIYRKTQNLKSGKGLKLDEYLSVLNVDMSDTYKTQGAVDYAISLFRVRKKDKSEVKTKSYKIKKLHEDIYNLLEAQYKVMAEEHIWDEYILTSHPIFKKLSK